MEKSIIVMGGYMFKKAIFCIYRGEVMRYFKAHLPIKCFPVPSRMVCIMLRVYLIPVLPFQLLLTYVSIALRLCWQCSPSLAFFVPIPALRQVSRGPSLIKLFFRAPGLHSTFFMFLSYSIYTYHFSCSKIGNPPGLLPPLTCT